MKILHVQAQLPTRTGSGVYFTNVIKELKPYASQTCIYGQYPGFHWDVLPNTQQFTVTFPNETCPFPLPGMSDVMPYENTIYGEMTPQMIRSWRLAFLEQLQQAVATFDPDVILCHHLWFLTDLVCDWFPEYKVMAICHNTDLRQAKQHPELAALYTTHLKRLSHVFALSDAQIETIHELFAISKDKISVLGGGYDQTIFNLLSYHHQKDRMQIVYCGKIAEAKGVFSLIETFKHLLKDEDDLNLLLIGNGDEESMARLQHMIADDPRISQHDAESQQELARHFGESAVFVLPSFYEGLPLVTVEAMACGCYVVVADFPALVSQLDEQLQEQGLIEYVALPALKNQDEPLVEELPAYHERLAQAIMTQVSRFKEAPHLALDYQEEIARNAWSGLVRELRRFLV